MPLQPERNITIRGTVMPPVHPHTGLILIRSGGNHPLDRYAASGPELQTNHQVTILHWASLLGAKIDFVLKPDPSMLEEPARDSKGHMQLVSFNRVKDLTTAQMVQKKAYTPDTLNELAGLMELRVLAKVPSSLSSGQPHLVDAVEIVQWTDDSVTSFEHHRAANGRLIPGRMLPPLKNLGELATDRKAPSDNSNENYLRSLADWTALVEHGHLLTVLSAIVAKNTPREREDHDPRLYALLRPASTVAAAAYNHLKQYLSQHAGGNAGENAQGTADQNVNHHIS